MGPANMQAAIISVIHNSGTLLTEEKFDSEPVLFELQTQATISRNPIFCYSRGCVQHVI